MAYADRHFLDARGKTLSVTFEAGPSTFRRRKRGYRKTAAADFRDFLGSLGRLTIRRLHSKCHRPTKKRPLCNLGGWLLA